MGACASKPLRHVRFRNNLVFFANSSILQNTKEGECLTLHSYSIQQEVVQIPSINVAPEEKASSTSVPPSADEPPRITDPTPQHLDMEEPSPDIMPFYDEAKRLATLTSLDVIDRPKEDRFDNITAIMQSIFNTPVSAITLLAETRTHFHSCAGEWAPSAPRKGSFCDRILEGACPKMLVVEDALQDSRFINNKYVVGHPYIRFYAGAPLVGSLGHRYGTLCIIDFVPRHFTADQYLILAHFAELATRELERESLAAEEQSELKSALTAASTTSSTTTTHNTSAPTTTTTPRKSHALRAIDALDEAVMMTDLSQPDWPVVYCNAAWAMTMMVGAPDWDWGTAAVAAAAEGLPVAHPPTSPLPPLVPFWQLVAGRAVDPREVEAAVRAGQRGLPFTLTVRSAVNSNQLLRLRFKPASEPGRLGHAKMPQIAVPSGIGMDWMSVRHQEQKASVALEGAERPRLGRSVLNPVSTELNDAKKMALLAALAAGGGGGSGNGGATTAEKALSATVTEEDVNAEPQYYLCVVMKQGPPPVGAAAVAAAAAAAAASAAAARSPPLPYGFDHDEIKNNSLGQFTNSSTGTTTNTNTTTSPTPDADIHAAMSTHAQIAAELACSAVSPSSPPPTPTTTELYTMSDVVGTAPSSDPHLPRSSVTSSTSSLPPPTSDTSGSWGLMDRPPPSLQGLSMGPLLGAGGGGRCYRGMWHATNTPVAVKVLDLWEERNAEGGGGGGCGSRTPYSIPSLCDSLDALVPRDGDLNRHRYHHPNLACILTTAVAQCSSPPLPHPPPPPTLDPPVHLQLWTVEQFCDRGSLGDAIETGLVCRRYSTTTTSTTKETDLKSILLTARDIAAGMAYLHDVMDTVHGQLTANNVLLVSDVKEGHRGWRALVGDYLLAAVLATSPVDGTTSVIAGDGVDTKRVRGSTVVCAGRPPCASHLPPEVLLGAAPSKSTDVFSWGVLLWELVSGRRAWRNLGPVGVGQAVGEQGCQLPMPRGAPTGVVAMLQRCWDQDPALRPRFSELVECVDMELSSTTGMVL